MIVCVYVCDTSVCSYFLNSGALDKGAIFGEERLILSRL